MTLAATGYLIAVIVTLTAIGRPHKATSVITDPCSRARDLDAC